MTLALCVVVMISIVWALKPVARDAWLEWQLRRLEREEERRYLEDVRREAARAFAESDAIREAEWRQDQAREARALQGLDDVEREGK